MKNAQFFPVGDINPAKGFPGVTIALIAVNVIIFVFEVLGNPDSIIRDFGFTPAYPSLLTATTSMFLHGGVAHILGNMWYLWIFGDNVESMMGHVKYFIFYMLSGYAATLVHYIFNMGSPVPSVGASGAISGVLGAYLVLFPGARVLVASGYGRSTVSAFIMIGIWFVMQLIFATTSLFQVADTGTAFWAHVGGFVFGLVAGLFFRRRL